jgi:hypothetical protein
VNLATGRDHRQFRVTIPMTGEEVHVTFSHEGLARLKTGLQRAGLHTSYFNWPPETDPIVRRTEACARSRRTTPLTWSAAREYVLSLVLVTNLVGFATEAEGRKTR